MLKLAFHIICLSVFDELRTGLLEPEVHFISTQILRRSITHSNHKGGLRNRILPLQLSVQSIRQQHKYLNLSFPAAVHRLLSYALWELSYRWASDNRRKSGFNRTTNGYIIISVSPIIGQTVRKRSIRLVIIIKCRSLRQRIISHASARHLSASSTKKSEVKQV